MTPVRGIAVDGFTRGNPGPSGYRGIDLKTNKVLFSVKLGHCTNNITEFIALVHGLSYRQLHRMPVPVYTDSQTALSWLEKRRVNSSISKEKSPTAYNYLERCLNWLTDKGQNLRREVDYMKWNTQMHGEIPADFGNKR